MSLFDRLFGNKKEKPKAEQQFKLLNGYTPAFTAWGGDTYESGLVRSAINAKAMHISKMSVRTIGTARPSLQAKLRAAPNEFQTWSQFLYRLATILEINTTAWILPVIDQFGDTTGIYCALPQQVKVLQYDGIPFLQFTFASGQVASIELSRVGIMTKFQYKNDLTGDGNSALSQTMALLDIQNQGIIEGTKNAATYRFMAQYSTLSFADDLAAEQERFNQSVAERGGLAVLFPASYSNIQQINSKPFVIDADQMRTIQANITNYFGVNERIMSNAATSEDLDAFYNGALEPFAIQLSEVLTKMLFSLNEQARGSKVLVTSDRLQYMSVVNKIRLISTLGDRGMLTINEARELLNYAPVDGGDKLMPIRGEYYNAHEGESLDSVMNESEESDNEEQP